MVVLLDYLLYDIKNPLINVLWSATFMSSWNPEPSVYFGCNSVAWFLSTLLFLIACTPVIYKIFCRISEEKKIKVGYIGVIVSLICMFIVNRSGKR